MCGICGVIHFDGRRVTEPLLQGMNRRLWHRGPEGAGYFIDGRVGLAMRRLRIIDIAGSDQPLYSENRAIALMFNGEIYNYRELRQGLEGRGHRFRTGGDGETINHLYEELGQACIEQLRGMFAIAIWDRRSGALLLSRDRLGQKPLYYYHDRRLFAFASEIKALLAHPDVPRRSRFSQDAKALAQYLSFGCVPAPDTAFAGIKMLPPASTLRVSLDGESRQTRYWDMRESAPQAAPDPNVRASDVIQPLRDQLDEAVKLRLISDVPLGAFLSGGLDSSLIVALMRRHSSGPVKTFSIGFEGADSFDETPYAQQAARHLDTQHQAFRVKPAAMNLLSDLVWHHDQPFADSSAIPTLLVSQLTRKHVTVALTGDGGDELFAGYERFYAAQLMRHLRFLPSAFWRMISKMPLSEGIGYYDSVKRLRRFANAAALPRYAGYFDLVRVCSGDLLAGLLAGSDVAPVDLSPYLDDLDDRAHPIAALLSANMRSYLPDDLLIKADRCSMAASLEARAPFLDHQLVEHAARIPFNLKLRGSRGKVILKEVARGILPDAIIDRRKHGFGIPLGSWLRRDMSPMRETLLSRRAQERGLLNMAALQRIIDEHEKRRRDNSRPLWALLTLEEWHRQFIDQPPAESTPGSACFLS